MLEVAEHRFDVDAVVFDKDGTLLEIDRLWVGAIRRWVEAIAEAAGSPGLAAPLRAALDINDDHSFIPNGVAHAGTTARARAAAVAVLERHGVADPVLLVASATTGGLDPNDVAPLGDVTGTLARLKRAGIGVAVATADDRNQTLMHLQLLGVTPYVDVVVCADDPAVEPKPSPRVFEFIAENLGVEQWRMAMVGDSATDMQTGRNGHAAGCIGITGDGGQPLGADLTVATVDALVPSILEN